MYERKFIIVQLWLTYKTSRNRLSPWLWKKLSQFMFWNFINIRKHVRDQSHVVNSQSLAQFFQIVESLKLSQIALQSLSLITASWPKKGLTKTNYATYSCINTQFLHLFFLLRLIKMNFLLLIWMYRMKRSRTLENKTQ